MAASAPAAPSQPSLPATTKPATPATLPATTKPAANGNSRLAKVQKGRLKMPLRVVFYGTEGVGKSTLAAHAPNPIWFDVDDGSGRLDVARYMFRDEPGGHVPTSYTEIVAGIDDLIFNEHDYQTLVIDTTDRLEALLWQHIIKRESKPGKAYESIEAFGYGKGYSIALDDWRALCARLDRLRNIRRMSVILLGHAVVKTFKNPSGEDYDRFNLRIHEKAAGFLKEWAEIVGFCFFEEGGSKLDGASRARGYSTGRRMVQTARSASADAKTRYAVPAEIELDAANPWAPFAKAVEDSASLDIPGLTALIGAEVTRIGDADLKVRVDAAVLDATKKGEVDALHRFLMDLKQRPAKAA